MSEDKCVTKDACVLSFKNFNAECYLSFGVNTQFNYYFKDDNKVQLERKNMDFTIPLESFNKMFKTLAN